MATEILSHNLPKLEAMDYLNQAQAVLGSAAVNAVGEAAEYRGLQMLVNATESEMLVANKEPSVEAFEKSFSALESARGLVSRFNDDGVDDPLLYATETLLGLAQSQLAHERKSFHKTLAQPA